MSEPLTAADLERMRLGHECCPCAARLLAEFERIWYAGFPAYAYGNEIPLPKEFDIGRALCGPSTSEELER